MSVIKHMTGKSSLLPDLKSQNVEPFGSIKKNIYIIHPVMNVTSVLLSDWLWIIICSKRHTQYVSTV